MFQLLIIPMFLVIAIFFLFRTVLPSAKYLIKYFALKKRVSTLNLNKKGLKGMELYREKLLLIFDVEEFEKKTYDFSDVLNKDKH